MGIKDYFSEEERKKHHDIIRTEERYNFIFKSVFWRANCIRFDVEDYLEADTKEEKEEALENLEYCLNCLKKALEHERKKLQEE